MILVDPLDHDDRIVHHHTGQGHHAENAHHGEIVSEQEVAPCGPDESERYGEQDDEGLCVGTEHGGDDHEHAEHGQRKPDVE